jgi:hypothetical protein
MITLRVREKGHLIEIPGMAAFRTPADIDVSRIGIRKVIGHLQVNGITQYQIVAINDKGDKEVYSEKDFVPQKKKKKVVVDPYKKQIETRFDKLENMILTLLSREKKGNEDINKEQITEKLDQLEELSKKILSKEPERIIYKDTKGQTWEKHEDEEEARFIPSIDIDDLKLKKSSVKTLKQDQKEEIDNAAYSLSELLGGKK